MEDSNASPLSLSACLIRIIGEAYDAGLTPDQVNGAITAVQQLVGQVSPSEQQKTGSQPGTAPRK